MPSSKSSDLFFLIKSMTKAEKRAFNLYVGKGSKSDLLFLKLFDLIDKSETPDDEVIFKKLKLASGGQYSNLKRHLYQQVLSSLRRLSIDKMPNIKIRSYIDMAYVLYGKGLYLQALNILGLAQHLCGKFETDVSLLTIIEFKKRIHSRHITRSKEGSVKALEEQSELLSASISNRVRLSNLKLHLQQVYVKRGHVKTPKEFQEIQSFFEEHITGISFDDLGSLEQVYYCQSYVWYHYIIDDFNACMAYARKWVDLFIQSPDLQRRDANLLLRGYHYLLTSAFNLKNFGDHDFILKELESYRKKNYNKFNKNNKIFSFLYVHTGRLNNFFLKQDYLNGVEVIPKTLRRIKRYHAHLDQHKVMVLHYKIAWMYIGAGQPAKSLSYLLGIISLQKKTLREDIQSYARLMHLMALYDLEDYLMTYNVLRNYKIYFEKVKEKNDLQKLCLKYFSFICNAPNIERSTHLKVFHQNLVDLYEKKYEKRAFLYLDIIPWIERKIRVEK